jgi:hypothetical protein
VEGSYERRWKVVVQGRVRRRPRESRKWTSLYQSHVPAVESFTPAGVTQHNITAPAWYVGLVLLTRQMSIEKKTVCEIKDSRLGSSSLAAVQIQIPIPAVHLCFYLHSCERGTLHNTTWTSDLHASRVLTTINHKTRSSTPRSPR